MNVSKKNKTKTIAKGIYKTCVEVAKIATGNVTDAKMPLDPSNIFREETNKLLPILNNPRNPSFFKVYLISHIFHDWRFGTSSKDCS